MSDQDKSDHWNSLAAGLGATPPADERGESSDSGEPEDVDTSTQAEVEEPVAEPPRPQVARKEPAPPTDWSKLVGDLGVEIPEQPSEPVSTQLDTFPPKADVDPPLRLVKEPREPVPLLTESVDDQAPAAEEDFAEEDSAEEDIEPAAATLPVRDDNGFGRGLFDDPSEVEDDDETAGFIAEVSEVDILDLDMDVEEAEIDAIVAEEPPAEKKPGRRRRKRRPRGRKSSESRTEESQEPTEDDKSGEAVVIGDDENEDTLEASHAGEETESASADSDAPPTKSKRRRRRRRGSGKKAATPPEDGEAAEAEAEKPDDEAKVEPKESGKGRGRRKTSREEESDDSEEDTSSKPAKDPHRAIPSWAEAIDVVVSANLENHKKNPGGGSRSRGGRKRGGRDKSSGKTK